MTLRVVYDTSVILAQMTPVPQDGSIIWRWMVDGLVEPVVSDYLVDEFAETWRCLALGWSGQRKREYSPSTSGMLWS